MTKRIIPYINVTDQNAEDLVNIALEYEINGADEVFIAEYRPIEEIQEEFLLTVKKIVKSVDCPVNIGVFVKRFEDVKKAFYTGAKAVVLQYASIKDVSVIDEAVKRFDHEHIIVDISGNETKETIEMLQAYGVTQIMTNHNENMGNIMNSKFDVYVNSNKNEVQDLYVIAAQDAVSALMLQKLPTNSIMTVKQQLKNKEIDVNTFESQINFKEFKLDDKGLIPAVVQDYKTNEVLMVGYMNEESFQKTIQTGRMTYFSRSRQELWLKGETSGHYQYVKELKLDCDKDTILAKVKQIGAACHTGNRSCFFNDLVKREYDSTNPFTVFEDVYGVIMDRKMHPKEGSYTNYLFDKGIDKILKKCGEEATEIVIAAKNPEVEELKYEISDFLYHCMVLMAERGVDWEDITKELAHRR